MADRRRDTLELVREIRGAPERVFRALTEPDELMKWWGGKGQLTRAQVNLRPGGEYRLDLASPDGSTEWAKGQYQVVEPPRRLVKTWFHSKFPDLRNTVEIRLEPVDAGARLTLVHSGLSGRPEAFAEYARVWPDVLDQLALLE